MRQQTSPRETLGATKSGGRFGTVADDRIYAAALETWREAGLRCSAFDQL